MKVKPSQYMYQLIELKQTSHTIFAFFKKIKIVKDQQYFVKLI